jgi:hypothetical protein
MAFPQAVCSDEILCEQLDEEVAANLQRFTVDVHLIMGVSRHPELSFRVDSLEYSNRERKVTCSITACYHRNIATFFSSG